MEYVFRSDEERNFAEFLDICKTNGLVSDWKYEPESFLLIPAKKIEEEVVMKTKTKIVLKHLLNDVQYTPDFRIELTNLGVARFGDLFKKSLMTAKVPNVVWVDTKGEYNRNGGDAAFSIIQRLTYHITGMYVEKVVPDRFFKKTFAPESVRWMKSRKIPTLTKLGTQTKNIDEFLKEIK